MRKRKRRHSGERVAPTAKACLQRADQRWAMDFVADTLAQGRTLRVLTVIDEYTREWLAIETDTSLRGLRVVRVLERLAQTRGLPEEISVDHELSAGDFFESGQGSSAVRTAVRPNHR